MEQPGASSKRPSGGCRSASDSAERLRHARAVVRGMRRAARMLGLTRAAAALVARRLGRSVHDVQATWDELCSKAVVKLAVLARGGGGGGGGAARPSALDWAVADLLLLYAPRNFDESISTGAARREQLRRTLHTVRRLSLEGRPAPVPAPAPAWRRAARYYTHLYSPISALMLQRRWHELKEETRGRALYGLPLHHIHREVLRRYPGAGAGEPPWGELVKAGLVAKPTSEYGPAPGERRAREPSEPPSCSDTDTASSGYDEGELLFRSIEKELFANTTPSEATQPRRNVGANKKCVESPTNVNKGSERKKLRLSVPETTDLSDLSDHDINCDDVDITRHSENVWRSEYYISVNNELNASNRRLRHRNVPDLDNDKIMTIENPSTHVDGKWCDYRNLNKDNEHISRIDNDKTVHNKDTYVANPKPNAEETQKNRGNTMDILYDVNLDDVVGFEALCESDEQCDDGSETFYGSDEDDKNSVALDLLSVEENPLFAVDEDSKRFLNQDSGEDELANCIDPKLLMIPKVVLTRIDEQPGEALNVASHSVPPSHHTSSSPVGPPWVVLTRIEDQPWFQACHRPNPNRSYHSSVLSKKSAVPPSARRSITSYEPMTPHSLPSPQWPPISHRPSSPYCLPSQWPPVTPWPSPTHVRQPSPHGPPIPLHSAHLLPQRCPVSFQHDNDESCLTEKHIDPYNRASGDSIKVVRRNKRCEVTAQLTPERLAWECPSRVARLMTHSDGEGVRGVIDQLAQLAGSAVVRDENLNRHGSRIRRLSSKSRTASDGGGRPSFQLSPPPTPASTPLSTHLPSSPQIVPSPHFVNKGAQLQEPMSCQLQRAFDLQKDFMEQSKLQAGVEQKGPRSQEVGKTMARIDLMKKSDKPLHDSAPNSIEADLVVNQANTLKATSPVARMTLPKPSAVLNILEKVLEHEPMLNSAQSIDLTKESDLVERNSVANATKTPILVSMLKAGPMVDLTQDSNWDKPNSIPVSSVQTNDPKQTKTSPLVTQLNAGQTVDLTEDLEEQNSTPKPNCSKRPAASFDSSVKQTSVTSLQSKQMEVSQDTDIVENDSIPNGSVQRNMTVQIASTQPGSAVDLTDDNDNPGDNKWRGASSLEWSTPPVASHLCATRATPPAPALCAPPAGVWAAGGCLLVSERALPEPDATLWTLRPRRPLRLVYNPEPAARPGGKPDRFRSPAPERIYTSDAVHQKMSDRPLCYAKLLVCVRDAHACRALLVRGAPLQLYCLRTGELYPLQAERVGGGCLRVSGAARAAAALDDARRAVVELRGPPPTPADAQVAYLERKHEQISSHPSAEFLFDVEDLLHWSHDRFLVTYRLPRDRALALILELIPLLPSGHVSREKKILMTLHYLSSTAGVESISGRHGVSGDELLRGAAEVVAALNQQEVAGKYLRLPDRQERDHIRNRFLSRWGVPDVCGAVAGVHVPVLPPPPHVPAHVRGRHVHGDTRNSEGSHSLNVQLVCDADAYIMCVETGHGGAVTDREAWARGELRARLQRYRRDMEPCWLLAGPSYPQEENLMLPIKSPSNSTEATYNAMHARAYSVVAECIAALRTRWPRLRLARHAPAAAKVITAGAVLHNIANSAADEIPVQGIKQSLTPQEVIIIRNRVCSTRNED